MPTKYTSTSRSSQSGSISSIVAGNAVSASVYSPAWPCMYSRSFTASQPAFVRPSDCSGCERDSLHRALIRRSALPSRQNPDRRLAGTDLGIAVALEVVHKAWRIRQCVAGGCDHGRRPRKHMLETARRGHGAQVPEIVGGGRAMRQIRVLELVGQHSLAPRRLVVEHADCRLDSRQWKETKAGLGRPDICGGRPKTEHRRPNQERGSWAAPKGCNEQWRGE